MNESQNHRGVEIPLKRIYSDADFNSRGDITPFDVLDLIEDIKANSLLQAIIVRPYKGTLDYDYVIVVGHRRYQAFKSMKRETIPAVIREMTDEQAAICNFSENAKRKDLNILQEAKFIARFKLYTLQQIADLLEVNVSWVRIRRMLLTLPEDIQKEAAAGYLNQTQILDIADLSSDDEKYQIVREIKDAKLRGEKRKFQIKKDKESFKRKKPEDKRVRDVGEMYRMQDLVRETIGNGQVTRTLAWAAGMITNGEFLEDIKQYAEEQGKVITKLEIR